MKPGLLLLACLGVAAAAGAQVLPAEPISAGGGRVVLGGDVSLSTAPDDPGFFNYSDYEHSTLREIRLGLTAAVRATSRVSFLGGIRAENDNVSPFALYARIQPLPGRRLDVQIGRVPPTFGAFTRRAYSRDNPLIGSPLAYQYLTSLRADAVPATVDELLRMRGRGWLTQFTVGNTQADRGLPIVNALRWDTGVQVSGGWRATTAAFSITAGSASNPRVVDDNAGKQLAGRITITPTAGLIVGSSWSRGEFLARRVAAAAGMTGTAGLVQAVHGLDIEYSRDRWLVRLDAVHSRWTLPFPGERRPRTLGAAAVALEGRYTILPGVYTAARAEHLAFSRVTGAVGTLAWDAPVSRVELGGGYYVRRNVVARAAWQRNVRDGGRVTRDDLAAAQLLFWF